MLPSQGSNSKTVDNYVSCIAVTRVVHHRFKGEFVEEDLCTFGLVHYCLNCTRN